MKILAYLYVYLANTSNLKICKNIMRALWATVKLICLSLGILFSVFCYMMVFGLELTSIVDGQMQLNPVLIKTNVLPLLFFAGHKGMSFWQAFGYSQGSGVGKILWLSMLLIGIILLILTIAAFIDLIAISAICIRHTWLNDVYCVSHNQRGYSYSRRDRSIVAYFKDQWNVFSKEFLPAN